MKPTSADPSFTYDLPPPQPRIIERRYVADHLPGFAGYQVVSAMSPQAYRASTPSAHPVVRVPGQVPEPPSC